MEMDIVNKPMEYFDTRGGLHDARITSISWSKNNKSLSLKIDDLNSNFLGMPEYSGCEPAEIIFTELTRMDCNIQLAEGDLGIYEINVKQSTNYYSVCIKCFPGGYIECQCNSIRVIKI